MNAETADLFMTVVSTSLGILVGALMTWVVSRHYYMRSGADLVRAAEDLKIETRALKSLTVNVARALEESGVAEFSKDQDGNIIGIVVHLAARSSLNMSGSADLTVRPKGESLAEIR